MLGALTLNYFGPPISFTLPQAAAIRHHRRRGRPDGDLYLSGQAIFRAAGGHRGGGVLVYGAGAVDPAADYESADHGDGRKIRMVQRTVVSGKILFGGVAHAGGAAAAGRRAAAGDVLLRQPDARKRRGGAS